VKKGREIYNRYYNLVKDNFSETVFPDEVDNDIKYSEGKTKQIIVNSYERNPLARQECIEHFGLNCQICDFNFQEKFGDLGRSFIHVHHIIDIATIGKEYSVNPKTDLIPVCPNCHAMLHKKKPAFTISELKEIMQ
ncbi:MAG TPA: HNH endonuclease, partial [Flavobacterium sp.]|uniref:HNH endonuclease n=1 Tax=Flavobacterium sp. TaxID=239 RepID=UPI002DB7A4F1